jgi:hypothetical protein
VAVVFNGGGGRGLLTAVFVFFALVAFFAVSMIGYAFSRMIFRGWL